MSGLAALSLALSVIALPASPAQEQAPSPTERFDQAVQAYRSGDYESAAALWSGLLSEASGEIDPSVLLYDLGNAAYRLDRPLEAAGWYTAAVRIAPRDGDAWSNLELSRQRARLDPADRGDLASTLRRLLSAVSVAEAEWALLVLALALTAVLAAQALLGGRALRRAAAVLAVALALGCLPWGWRLAQEGGDPLFVVAVGGATIRSEPRLQSPAIGRAEPGSEVEREDALPGWVRVAAADGTRGWVAEDELLSLSVPRSRL